MEIYNLKCPGCGAALATDVKSGRARCEYCGNEFIIGDTDGGPGPADKHEHGKEAPAKSDDGPHKEWRRQAGPPAGSRSSSPEGKKEKSPFRSALIVLMIVIAGLALSLAFDKEKPQDIVPGTDMHRFFMELRPDSRPQDTESLAKKYGLHFFRTEKAVHSGAANIICYKVAKTNETVLNMKDSHAEIIEIEFDAAGKDALMWASYADPEHIMSRALIYNYGTFRSIPADKTTAPGFYYYNNSLRSSNGAAGTGLPYLKCADASEALKKIYTYK